MNNEYPFVTVVVPCRNEQKRIRASLDSLLANKRTYPRDKIEILVLDGMSNDDTAIVLSKYEKLGEIKVFKNKKQTVPAAMNLGIQKSEGEIIIRADAHVIYADDYILQSVKLLNDENVWCAGGYITTLPGTNSLISGIIAVFLSSSFGVGRAFFRTKKYEGYVDTVPFGAFRKTMFERIGGYKEDLIRHQDYELCSRIRLNNGKVFLSSKIKSKYYARSGLTGLLKQAFNNGMWDAFSHYKYPYTFNLRHSIIPAGFSVMVLFALSFLFFHWPIGYYSLILLGLYFLFGMMSGIKKDKKKGFLIPLIGLPYHFVFGLGVFFGWYRNLTVKRKFK
jgi:glycosyltransferase involved in cell wall biosynthesis